MSTLLVQIDTKELDRLGVTWQQAMPVLVDVIHESVQSMTLEVTAKAIDNVPKSTGDLARTIGQKVETVGGKVTGTVGQDGRRAPYGVVVEYGSDKRWFPPVDALKGWVIRTARYDQSAFGGINIDKDDQVRSAAFLVARAIARRGYRAQPFMHPALDEKRGAIEAEFRGIPKRFIARLRTAR